MSGGMLFDRASKIAGESQIERVASRSADLHGRHLARERSELESQVEIDLPLIFSDQQRHMNRPPAQRFQVNVWDIFEIDENKVSRSRERAHDVMINAS